MARTNSTRLDPIQPEDTKPQYRHPTDTEKFNLGMPLEAFGVPHSFEGIAAGHQWTGYRITNIGLIPLPPTLLPNDPAEPIPEYPWPHWGTAYAGLGFVLMQLWLRIVTHTQTPAYVQARWSPEQNQTRIALLGLEQCRTDNQRELALRADKLLRLDLKTWKKSTQEAREDIKAAIAYIRERARAEGTRPRFDRRAMSEALFLSESGYDDFLRRHNLEVTKTGHIQERT